MRLFVSGSAPLPIETHQEFLRRTGHVILERYGMTETLINASNPYDGPRVPGSVGPALPGIAIRVTNRDSGTVEPKPDVIGTLEIAGPNVFAGYWRDSDRTSAEFTADGWFKTGDLGRIDRDRKSTRLNSSHRCISYAVFCLKKKKNTIKVKDPGEPSFTFVREARAWRLSVDLLISYIYLVGSDHIDPADLDSLHSMFPVDAQ